MTERKLLGRAVCINAKKPDGVTFFTVIREGFIYDLYEADDAHLARLDRISIKEGELYYSFSRNRFGAFEGAEQVQAPPKAAKQPALPVEAWADKSKRAGVDYLAINKDIAGGKK